MNAYPLFSWNTHISRDIWEFDHFKIIFCLQFWAFHKIYDFKHSYLVSHQNNEICDYDDFLDNLLRIHHGRTESNFVSYTSNGRVYILCLVLWLYPLKFSMILFQTLLMIYALAYNTIIPSHSSTITTHIQVPYCCIMQCDTRLILQELHSGYLSAKNLPSPSD